VAGELGIAPGSLESSLAEGRRRLFEARERRVHPGRDEKVLTAWNGMMLRTLAEAAAVLERDDYRGAATRNAGFLVRELVRDGRVLRSWKDGIAKIDGYLEDYALLIDGLLGVHELTFDAGWIAQAGALAARMVDQFWDEETGLFYDTGRDAEPLVVRPRDPLDNATPSGTSVAVSVLLRLGVLLDDAAHTRRAATVLSSQREALARFPTAFGEALQALDFHLSMPIEIAVVGDRDAPQTRALLREVYGRFLPHKVVLGRPPHDKRLDQMSPLMLGKEMLDGQAAAYVCEHYACQAPTADPAELARQLSG
jgi:uncharacterized protein YyaL (SSP411 family)